MLRNHKPGKSAKKSPVETGVRGHSAGRHHLSEGQNSRALQDSGFGGRGDIANKERTQGKSLNRRYTKKPKQGAITKDLRRVHKNIAA